MYVQCEWHGGSARLTPTSQQEVRGMSRMRLFQEEVSVMVAGTDEFHPPLGEGQLVFSRLF